MARIPLNRFVDRNCELRRGMVDGCMRGQAFGSRILERSQDKAYLKTMWRYKIICELKLPEELKAEEHMKGKKGWKRERKLKRRLGRRRGK